MLRKDSIKDVVDMISKYYDLTFISHILVDLEMLNQSSKLLDQLLHLTQLQHIFRSQLCTVNKTD